MSDNINYFWETNWIYTLLPCAPTLYKFSSSLPLPLLHHQHCSRWSTPLQTNTSMPLGKAAGVTCNNSALCPSKHFCPFQMECMAFKQLTKWWLGGGDMARVVWWLLEKSLRPAAPVCDDCFSHRVTAVLWMLCPVVVHLTESGLMYYTVPFPFWLGDWQCDVFLDISDYPEGKNVCVCAFVCNWPLSDAHCFSIFFHFSFSPGANAFTKVLVTLLGLLNELYMFHLGTPSTKYTGKPGKKKPKVHASICHLCEV